MGAPMLRGLNDLGSRILIVDDQEVNLRLLELILRREGFTAVHAVSDPYQVLPTVVAYQPDVVLLDLMMPELDGFAILELLRRRVSLDSFLPVLVLTADLNQETRRRALALGAKDFLTKPFDPIEVVLRIWNLLETRMLYRQLQQRQEQSAAQEQGQHPGAEDAAVATSRRVARLVALAAQQLGLQGAQIEQLEQLVAAASLLDGLTRPGPERPPLTPAVALEAIRTVGGPLYSPQVVAALAGALAQE